MMYLKSILVGIVAAVAASVLWILTVLVIPTLIALFMSRGTGSGGIGAVSASSGELLAAALVGFVIGFCWQLRRFSKSRVQDR